MALPKCGHCDGRSFGVHEVSAAGAAFKHTAMTCNNCGAIMGIMDYFNLGQLLKQQEDAIAVLLKKVGHIETMLQAMRNALR